MTDGSASDDGSSSRPFRILAVTTRIAVVVLALLGSYLLLATFVLHGRVNAWSILESVSGAAGSAAVIGPPCERSGSSRDWTCTVIGPGGSGSARYRVSMRPGSSCWNADLVLDQAEDAMPKRLTGCVYRIESPY